MINNINEETALATAVTQLATAVKPLSDADLGQPYQWQKHNEGVRMAVLGTVHELQDLAVKLQQKRGENKQPITAVQRLLAQKHLGYRDLQATLIGITEAEYDQEPAPGEWPLRFVYGHIVGAERWFFTLAFLGLQHGRAHTAPPPLEDDDPEKLLDGNDVFAQFREGCTRAEMQAYHENLHGRILQTFSDVTDEELNAPTPLWWEDENYPIQYRLQRFDAHLQQHLFQAEKTCDQIGKLPSEGSRLVRHLFRALAEVEGLQIGVSSLCHSEQEELAGLIRERTGEILAIIETTHQLETAVKAGDLTKINKMLTFRPDLVNATDQNELPLVLTAAYHRQPEAAQLFIDAGARLSIFSASALGNLERVQKLIESWPEDLNDVGRDGFTPLQLACFFGQEEAALWLIAQGADVNAVAQNSFQISPIHAAAASNKLAIIKALLQNDANINVKQMAGVTPLHQAAHANNVAMIQLLLDHAADATLTNDEGQTPLDLALADGNQNAVTLLKSVT